MKLGEQLAKTFAELETAKITALNERAAADLVKVRRERDTLNHFVDDFRQYLIDTITAEKVPAKKVSDYTRQEWIRQAIKRNAKHQDIWDGLSKWAREQALVIVAREEHDGVGMESWITLTANAVRGSTRDIDYYEGNRG